MKFINAKKVKIVLILVGVLVAGSFVYVKFFKTSKQTISYKTSKVEKGTLISAISGSGTVTSTNSAQVSTSVSGTVTKVYVKDGDAVKSGQVIAEIDLDQESKQNYMQALSSYQSAKNSLETAKISNQSLKAEMVAAQQNFITQVLNKGKDDDNPLYIELNAKKKASEAKYANQENVIKQAETSLSSSWYSLRQSSPVIYAPATGKITGFSLQVGSVITSQKNSSNITVSSRIANVLTSATPMISIDLTEIDIPKVKIGNKATVTLEALPDKTFTGKVISIDTSGVVSSGVTTYPTVIQLDVYSSDIYSNMSASASIITDSKEAVLMVPTSAVIARNGGSAVRILNNNAVDYLDVETGLTSDTSIEIVSGLTEGQEVITSVINSSSSNSNSSTSPFGIRTGSFAGPSGGRMGR